jgi:methylamine dehydrogenase accessory protein MauD
MEVVLLVARLVLALVFGTAGVAKAFDLAGSRRSFTEFGVPQGLATPLSWSLPVIEILIALALVPLGTAWWGSIAALVMLSIFTAAIGVSLARGRSPDCHCFGRLHSEPVSRATLARDLALVAVAGLVVAQGRDNPGLSATSWLGDLRTAEVTFLILGTCLIALVAAATAFLNRMLKQQAKLLSGIEAVRIALNEDGEHGTIVRKEAAPPQEGLPIGAMAPKFSLATVNGDAISLDNLLEQGKSVLLVFASPNCWGCKVLLPVVRVWQKDYANQLTVAVVSKGTLEENRSQMAKYEINDLLVDEDSEVSDNYQAKWSPAALLINPDGRIASHLSLGDSAIREWLRNLISSGDLQNTGPDENGASVHIPQVALNYAVRKIGEPAPSFELKDLSGKSVRLQDLRGSSTLLLFWHPRCKICKTLWNDLLAWEEHPPTGAPRLVFVATGEPKDIKAGGRRFRSTTLLDPTFDIAPLFGTKFTPSAILIDSEGRIASSLAIRADNVRALIGLPKADLPVALQLPEALYGAEA